MWKTKFLPKQQKFLPFSSSTVQLAARFAAAGEKEEGTAVWRPKRFLR
jgi:hypothetical protein